MEASFYTRYFPQVVTVKEKGITYLVSPQAVEAGLRTKHGTTSESENMLLKLVKTISSGLELPSGREHYRIEDDFESC